MSQKIDKAVSLEETVAELYVSALMNLKNSTLSIADMYDKKYKMYRNLLVEHYNSEPSKVFKKAHKRWEEKKEELEKQTESAFEKYMEECTDLGEIMELMQPKRVIQND